MKLNPERIRRHLQNFDFTTLFVEELGWEAPRAASLPAPAPEYSLREVAHLGGIPALEVLCCGEFPDSKARRELHHAIAQQFHENLLLFVDESKTKMLWHWQKREGGKSAVREHHYVKGQPGDLFLSKLAGLFVDLEEYDQSGAFSVLRAGQKLKEALDVSKVTKKFYGDFSKVHLELVELLEGIPTEAERKWYASVLLNRLMFVYFLQKKGFLDGGDFNYLEHRFAQFQSGNIYQQFLKPLFFTAFALPDDHTKKIGARAVFGKIPYLNGGLFLPHAIEEKYQDTLTLSNAGPQNILRLFQSVSWYLNDLPGADDNAMSPDVLGYIFEKYINDQKSAGAYYTPPELTEYLCERTIGDLLIERVSVLRGGKATKYSSVGELLLDLDAASCRVTLGVLDELRLCDPAVGSGAFLVAALKTLTALYGALWGRAEVLGDAELKRLLIGDEAKHNSPFYAIRKRIITHNLYGVDLMAESTEIARLRLFLALVSSAHTLDELEPLPNIEFNILAGNSLIGMLHCEEENFAGSKTTTGGMFVKTEFDELAKEKAHFVDLYKKSAAHDLGELVDIKHRANALRGELKTLCDGVVLEEFKGLKIMLETPRTPSVSDGLTAEVTSAPRSRSGFAKSAKREPQISDIEKLAPFHWGSEFEEVMQNGGFDAIITNPPWEIWKPNARDFFQQFSDAVNRRGITIKEFEKHQSELLRDPETAAAWREYLAGFPHVSEYFRQCPDYKNQISVVNGKKQGTDINLYKLFVERCYDLLHENGRCGIVIPSGIYTDLGAKQLRELLFGNTQISGLFGFENRKAIFEGVDSRFKFVALSFCKGGSTRSFPAAFMRHEVSELADFPRADSLHIGVDLVRKLSPDSLSVMEFKSERDIAIAEKMLRFPLLGQKIEGAWNLSLTREFDMTNDSHLFQTAPSPVGAHGNVPPPASEKGALPCAPTLPLFEGKMIWHFTHEYADARYWVDEKAARKSLLGRGTSDESQPLSYQRPRFAFRTITGATNERTMVCSIIPHNVFAGNSLVVSKYSPDSELSGAKLLFVAAVMSSFVVDYSFRQRVATQMNMFFVYQTPIPRLSTPDPQFAPIVTRAAKLICTTPEFDELARAAGLRSHRDGVTDAAGRATLRAELDGLVAQLYGLSKDDFAHILNTFPLVEQSIKDAALAAFTQS